MPLGLWRLSVWLLSFIWSILFLQLWLIFIFTGALFYVWVGQLNSLWCYDSIFFLYKNLIKKKHNHKYSQESKSLCCCDLCYWYQFIEHYKHGFKNRIGRFNWEPAFNPVRLWQKTENILKTSKQWNRPVQPKNRKLNRFLTGWGIFIFFYFPGDYITSFWPFCPKI